MSIYRKFVLFGFVVFVIFQNSAHAYTNLWIPAGLSDKNVRVLSVDPHNSSDIYVGTFYQGFFKSTDGGLTWSELSIENGSFTSIQFDSQTPGVLYVLSYSGLFKSTDYGINWKKIYSLLPMCNHLVIDPQSPQILYVGAWWAGGSAQGGVLKSLDGGIHWTFIGLDGYDVIRLAIDPENPLTIYAATDKGMFKSLDGGATWTDINLGLTSLWCHRIVLDPNAPETLYAGTKGGVFKSTDGGATWSERNSGITDLNISILEINPYSSQNLCASSWWHVFLSTDGGDTWLESDDGLPESNITSTALISSSPTTIYAGTSGDGVYMNTEKPYISAAPETLNFGFVSLNQKTPDQSLYILNLGGGTFTWNIIVNTPWLSCFPASGNDASEVKVSIDASNLAPGTYDSIIEVFSNEAFNTSFSIDVKLRVYAPGTDNPPIGFFDTPIDNSLVSGSVAVTGWALDDIQVERIEIKRNAGPLDPPEIIGEDGLVYIGDGIFVDGARPDVTASCQDYPLNTRAGWGYMMLTCGLPNRGNGTFDIYVFAYDGTGHRVRLGQKVIYCDNANRIKPFGTVDTPAQGGVASGVDYVNFGWALTPQPKYIPVDGSTITVWVDGVPLGNPDYGHYRGDIAARFPGYANSDGAVGFYILDTTRYSNGVHTIAWSVRDSNDDGDGIGARKFEIQNLGGTLANTMSFDVNSLQVDTSGRLRLRVMGMERGYRGKEVEGREERQIRLMSEGREKMLEAVRKREDGAYEVEIEELERIEIHFSGEGGNTLVGWGANPNRPLPIGSTLDEKEGVFYWLPCAGFLGDHVLHIAVTDGICRSQPVRVVVTIKPKKYNKIG